MSRHLTVRGRFLFLVPVALAAVVSVLGVPVTSAQGTTLFPVRVGGDLPEDAPFDSAWDAVRPRDIVLGGQPVTQPMLLAPAFASIRVRSMVNDSRLAILLEWEDETADESTGDATRFADAAAIQLALGTGTSICMGQQAGGLNIWHWKADWAAAAAGQASPADTHPNVPDDPHFPTDVVDGMGEAGFLTAADAGNPRAASAFVSSVEDLNAVGFGSLTSQETTGQNVHGASQHRDGVWRVVMSRALSDGDLNDAVLQAGGSATAVAFAVWDGGRGDRDGQKSVSAWVALSLPPREFGLVDMWPFLAMLALAIGLSAGVLWIGSRQPAIGMGFPPGGPRRSDEDPPVGT